MSYCEEYVNAILDELLEAHKHNSITEYIDNHMVDVEYTLNCDKIYIGAKIYVTLGGPTAYIDTRNSVVTCIYGSDKFSAPLDEDIGIEIDNIFDYLF